jgi:predicted 3-demethylubiquinone-9 3-methyltransferase (glyoxalase superfamily)
MKPITPFLWFDHQAEEAAEFYVSVFRDSKITKIARYPKATEKVAGKPEGSVMTVAFEIDGREFVALNGGPHFTFSPAISFVVYRDTQADIDDLWEKLSDGGAEEQCGWLRDKYGVSWQVVPTALDELLETSDTDKRERAMTALLRMKKIDIAQLEQA